MNVQVRHAETEPWLGNIVAMIYPELSLSQTLQFLCTLPRLSHLSNKVSTVAEQETHRGVTVELRSQSYQTMGPQLEPRQCFPHLCQPSYSVAKSLHKHCIKKWHTLS